APLAGRGARHLQRDEQARYEDERVLDAVPFGEEPPKRVPVEEPLRAELLEREGGIAHRDASDLEARHELEADEERPEHERGADRNDGPQAGGIGPADELPDDPQRDQLI